MKITLNNISNNSTLTLRNISQCTTTGVETYNPLVGVVSTAVCCG